MKISIIILLHEDPAAGKEGCISHDDKRVVYVGEVEHWSVLKMSQQHSESSLLVGAPSPRLGLACQDSEGGDYI